MISRSLHLVFALLLLVAVTTVEAAPTIDDTGAKPVAQPVSPAFEADIGSADEVGLLSGAGDSALADIAAEFLKPPADLTDLSALPPGTRSLPAVPAALFMGLTGFLCVSLVQDRRVWIAALAGLLWVSQAGFAVLPRLASHLAGKKQRQQTWINPIHTCALEDLDRRRSDIEGTKYIGLLHHLEGIPVTQMSFLRKQESKKLSVLPSLRAWRSNLVSLYAKCTASLQTGDISNVPQYAVSTDYFCFIESFICLSFEVRQFVCFSPAFIFAELPRGPPKRPLCDLQPSST